MPTFAAYWQDDDLQQRESLGILTPERVAQEKAGRNRDRRGLVADILPDARVFALDTGRLHEETYEAAEAVRRKLGVRIEWHFPDRAAVERLERTKGLYSFRDSLENRHES